jgi:anti-anti-sigma factor
MFDVSVQGAVTVIHLAKPLIGEVAETFLQISEQTLRGGQPMVVFDMSEVPFVDGEGLEALLNVQDAFLKRGGRFNVTMPNPLVCDLLRITRVMDRFEVHQSVSLAVGSFAR